MSKLNVLYQSNDNYSLITGVSICSLLKNNNNIDELTIYILDNGISDENKIKLKKLCKEHNRKLIFVDVKPFEEKTKEYNLAPYKGDYTTYYKLFAFEHLKTNNDKLLYLDGDTIINSSLKELADLNIENDVILASYDCIPNYYKKFVNIPSKEPYYNAGVLYINQENWRNLAYDKIIKNHLKNVENRYALADQDILNCLFRNNITYLDTGYNFNSGFYIYGIDESFTLYDLKDTCFHDKGLLKDRYNNPIIDHCMGAMTGRPWEKDNTHPINEKFNYYLALTPWKDCEKKEMKTSPLFLIQKALYSILPLKIYIILHKCIQKQFYANQNKNIRK